MIRREVKCVLVDYGFGLGYIFNLGYGIIFDIDLDYMVVMVDVVWEFG